MSLEVTDLSRSISCPSIALSESQAAPSYSEDPLKAQIITKDVALFWKLYDNMPLSQRGEFLQKEYLDQSSEAVQMFIDAGRIKSADSLAEALTSRPELYSFEARKRTLEVQPHIDAIYTSFCRFKEIYPEAIFPNVYFVIGEGRCGGYSDIETKSLIIGAEVMAQDEYEGLIPYIVAHELIHAQQTDDLPEEKNWSVLVTAICEGSADFLGELISGGLTYTQKQLDFIACHEKELFNLFEQDIHSEDEQKIKSWFFGGDPVMENAPHFLGYYIGYKICKNFYEKADDKDKAIQMLLKSSSAPRIFEAYKNGLQS